MKPRIKSIHHHAKKHQEAHLRLKDLLRNAPNPEKVWPTFIVTFAFALFSILIFTNWGSIIEAFKPGPKPPAQIVQTRGFQTGMLSVYKVEKQATDIKRRVIASVPAKGSLIGTQASRGFGYPPKDIIDVQTEPIPFRDPTATFKESIELTNYLSTGQHLTMLPQARSSTAYSAGPRTTR